MAPRTERGVRARLERAGLLNLALAPATSTPTIVADGVVHQPFCTRATAFRRDGSAAFVEGALPLREVLDQYDALHDCMKFALDTYGQVAVHGQDRVFPVLLHASELARKCMRLASDASRKPGLVSAALSAIDVETQKLTATATPAAAQDAAEAVTRALQTAQEALNASWSENLEVIKSSVRDRIVPERFRRWITLNETPTLIGIAPHGTVMREMDDVLRAFTRAQPSRTKLLLVAPQFVADYINRYYDRGNNWRASIQQMDLGDIDDGLIDVIAHLWDPSERGPMSDLRSAVAVARQVTSTAA